MANPYSTYNPVTYGDIPHFMPDWQVLGAKVQAQQQGWDQAELIMDTAINAFGAEDQAKAQEIYDWRKQAMGSVADAFMNSGINAGNKALKSLVRDVRKDYSDPTSLVYKIQKNYADGQSTLKSIDEWDAPEWMKQAEKYRVTSQWNGTIGKGSTPDNPIYNQFPQATLPDYIDINKELLPFGTEISPGVKEYFSGTPQQMYSNDKGFYYLDKGQEKYLTPEDLQRVFSPLIQTNPKMMEWVKKETELRLLLQGADENTWAQHRAERIQENTDELAFLNKGDRAAIRKAFEQEGRDFKLWSLDEHIDAEKERLLAEIYDLSKINDYSGYVSKYAQDQVDMHAATMAGVFKRYEHYIYLSKIDFLTEGITDPTKGLTELIEERMASLLSNKTVREEEIEDIFPGLDISGNEITIYKEPLKLGSKELTLNKFNEELDLLGTATQTSIEKFPEAFYDKLKQFIIDEYNDPQTIINQLDSYVLNQSKGKASLFNLDKEDIDNDGAFDKISFNPIEDPEQLRTVLGDQAYEAFAEFTKIAETETLGLQSEIYKHNMLSNIRDEYMNERTVQWEMEKARQGDFYQKVKDATQNLELLFYGDLNEQLGGLSAEAWAKRINSSLIGTTPTQAEIDANIQNRINEVKKRAEAAGLDTEFNYDEMFKKVEKEFEEDFSRKLFQAYMENYKDNITSEVQLITLETHAMASGDSKVQNQLESLRGNIVDRLTQLDPARIRYFFDGEQVLNANAEDDIREQTKSVRALSVGLIRDPNGILKWHYVFTPEDADGNIIQRKRQSGAKARPDDRIMIEIDPADGDYTALNQYFHLNLNDRLTQLQELDAQIGSKGYFEYDFDIGTDTPLKLKAIQKMDLYPDWFTNGPKDQDISMKYAATIDGISLPGVKSNFDLIRLLEDFQELKNIAGTFSLNGVSPADISEDLNLILSGGHWNLNKYQVEALQDKIMVGRAEGTILGDYTDGTDIYNAFADLDFADFEAAIPKVEDAVGTGTNPNSSATGKYQILWDEWEPVITKVTGITDQEEFRKNDNAQKEVLEWMYNEQYIPQANTLKRIFNMNERASQQFVPMLHFMGYQNAFNFINTLREDGLQAAEREFKMNNPNNSSVLTYMRKLIIELTN